MKKIFAASHTRQIPTVRKSDFGANIHAILSPVKRPFLSSISCYLIPHVLAIIIFLP